jgi:ABC-type multidrug transport system fused ATPase/permease subunit
MLPMIVNYAAIGIAFFYVQKSSNAISNFSEAEAAAFVARNSFACLYLINCFSKIFECCQIATELFGSSRRIAELIERSREDDLTSVVSTKSNYPSLLQRFNDTILKCFRNDRDAPTNYSLLSCDDESVELCEPNVYIPPFGKRMADGNAVRMSKINGKDILLEVENLKLISPNGDLLLNSLAFSVTNEMRLLIKGKSGCGKSTLLRYLAFGIRTNSSKTNSITANSIKCYIRKENIIFLPQQSRCVQVPPCIG